MKKFLIDVCTNCPALYVLTLGLKSCGYGEVGQIIGAVLLITLNNLGRTLLTHNE